MGGQQSLGVLQGVRNKSMGPGWMAGERIAASPPPHPQVFEFGHVNRVTECTNLNEHSSRSHALLIVTVRGLDRSTGLRTTGGGRAPRRGCRAVLAVLTFICAPREAEPGGPGGFGARRALGRRRQPAA